VISCAKKIFMQILHKTELRNTYRQLTWLTGCQIIKHTRQNKTPSFPSRIYSFHVDALKVNGLGVCYCVLQMVQIKVLGLWVLQIGEARSWHNLMAKQMAIDQL
jgi:hypothetical protein